jgi:putative nucleotidyltransferase with HDIG domain
MEAIRCLDKFHFDLALLDINMPEIDGFQVMDHLAHQNFDTTVIVITGDPSTKSAIEALKKGAFYYVIKPFGREELLKTIENALEKRRLKNEKKRAEEALQKAHEELEIKVKERTKELLKTNEQLKKEIKWRKNAEEGLNKSIEKLRKALDGTIQAMSLTVEIRDPHTAGHQRRVAQLSRSIAMAMGLSGERVNGISMAGVVHDLGKISVPAEILSKPGQITDIEMSLIRNHPQVGYDILKKIEFPWEIAQIVLQHHERSDGSGYPRGLSGENILLEAKILAVADVIEAMASHRPYRPSLGLAQALKEISENRGILYDPKVVDACIGLFNKKKFAFE